MEGDSSNGWTSAGCSIRMTGLLLRSLSLRGCNGSLFHIITMYEAECNALFINCQYSAADNSMVFQARS